MYFRRITLTTKPMITYELAKKLKEAGFPETTEQHAGYTEEGARIMLQKRVDFVYPPTLSELIEACGDACFKVYCMPGRYVVAREASEAMEERSTPEEAVANLWLELNN
jgi:hypothetical protein